MTSSTSMDRLDRAGARLLVPGDDGSDLEGVVVEGKRDDAERFRVNGWCCLVETGVAA
ncbi:MAG: hypothetical protein ACRYG8_46275 [Janthinobacterium lividum]